MGLETIRAKYANEGKELNEKYEVVKNGKVIETKRKLSKEEIDSRVRACPE